MGELGTALLIGTAIVAVVGAVPLLVSLCWPNHLPPDQRAAAITESLHAEGLDEDMQSQYWPAGWPHEAPDRRLSITEAHQAVQRHRACEADECPRKDAALRVLVQSGRVVLDPRRGY
ncbi:hypothetical protein [Nocardia asteroides]|uniref:hypothetical protein n=1 Tax=Nocardia asteroides TaxID=1824 RepID=UPI001E5530EC|nr:hypothetical protein [Nocardia asteroides]UGT63944.1 hypothetical protein LTT61_11830 [Nocardia asteroides]